MLKVEHTLSLYKDVNSLIHDLVTGLGLADGKGEGTKGSDGAQSQWFLEKDWGEKAHLLQLTIVNLTHEHWDMIKSDADAHLNLKPQTCGVNQSKGKVVDNKDKASLYPHAHLIVDWYVLFN